MEVPDSSQSVSHRVSVNYIELWGKLTASFHLISWTSSSWVRCDSLPRLLIFLGSSFWYLEQRDVVRWELTARLTEVGDSLYSVVSSQCRQLYLTHSQPVKSQPPSRPAARQTEAVVTVVEWSDVLWGVRERESCGVIVTAQGQLTGNQLIISLYT